MADLRRLQRIAEENGFGLTRPLTHEQVVRLAEHWFPEMRFHELERFHPVSLDEIISMAEGGFAALPPTEQENFRVRLRVRGGEFGFTSRDFDPPVVHAPDGTVQLGNLTIPVRRALDETVPTADALADAEADGDAVVTHGASFARADKFFGPERTLSGGGAAAPDDPFLPRAAGEDGRPRVTVVASLMNLIDLLKYELIVEGLREEAEDAGEEFPPDALRGAFDIADSLLLPAAIPALPLPREVLRDFLLDLIEAHETNGQAPPPPFGFRLNRDAWNAVTRFAFLEYDFFYAYNDFNRHEAALFANEHEGDNEGCCLVFDRNVLNLAATVNDPDALLRAVPHSVITSIHEENQRADLFKLFDAPPPAAGPARPSVEFTVYPAAGSHATYLTPGDHDIVDFQDYTEYIKENPAVLLIPGAIPVIVSVLIILSIIEHFTDTEDHTSDRGVRTGPDEVVGPHPAAVASRLVVMPMSADNHVYQPQNEGLLRLRSYAGKWGGHDGIVDKSPKFKPKTARYFRKLLSQL